MSIEVGQRWYNPQGYFALRVEAIQGNDVVFSTNDPRDCQRTIPREYVICNWNLIQE